MGSPSLMIVLILVVWVIVLAPLMFGNNKPIRRSGEGYEETRVLHEGGTAPMASRRRPKLTAADIHRHGDADGADYEVVEATAEEEGVLIDDAPALRTIFRRGAAADTDTDTDADTDAAAATSTVEGELIEHIEDEQDEAAGGSTKVSAAKATSGSTVAKLEGGSTVVARADDASAAEDASDEEGVEDRYELDESFTSAEDYGYASARGAEKTDAPVAEQADTDAEADAADTTTRRNVEPASAGEASEAGKASEADEADIAFAASRRGRGGYDPEREKKTAADRFNRRQRTLLGLIAACVVTFVIAFVSGGWTWVLPLLSLGLTVWFMVALRKVVLQERALHEQRLRQLRRARMGVATAEDGNRARDARLRAGSVVLDLDDDSPDFDALPATRAHADREDRADGASRLGRDFDAEDGYLGGYGTRAS
ncbi:gephyrin-like molybdotransferase receptor GlpR [Corynebacterium jeddahense]|uniref:Transmembrane protein n=1 Tax=Corynebacterium jeddahense TaxID=1414719 RepID=A0ABY7UKZ6_9CORY|nr:gephyrin-like molybdotransferase receptor GlpR [Corynebacterium jeddahense]WCZ38354.1 hypothetical protein CJEDD_03690 [Corynebacterium jeddahense]